MTIDGVEVTTTPTAQVVAVAGGSPVAQVTAVVGAAGSVAVTTVRPTAQVAAVAPRIVTLGAVATPDIDVHASTPPVGQISMIGFPGPPGPQGPPGTGGDGTDEVWIGPDEPADPNLELWYDTDAIAVPGTGGGGVDEVWIGPDLPTDPNLELWYDTDAPSPPSTGGGIDEVWVGPDEPADPNLELWYDTNAPTPEPPSGGGTGSYIHNQAVPASVWVITHNLGFYPNASVVDSAGSNVEGDPVQISADVMQITFSGSFTGVAYLS